jgi:exportin-1
MTQVLKKDWPARWPTFIPELVGASKTSENLCENSMHILRLLSEEVFDFSRGELTQAKTRILKAQLNSEFESIHELCHCVLHSTELWASRPALIKATLSALQVCYLLACNGQGTLSVPPQHTHLCSCTYVDMGCA